MLHLSNGRPQRFRQAILLLGRIFGLAGRIRARGVNHQSTCSESDIETAAANLRAANASVTSANAALWPTASLGLNGSRNHADGTGRNSFSAEVSGGLSLNLAGSEFWQADAATQGHGFRLYA